MNASACSVTYHAAENPSRYARATDPIELPAPMLVAATAQPTIHTPQVRPPS